MPLTLLCASSSRVSIPSPYPRRALLDGVIRLSCRVDVQQDVRRVLGPVHPESHEASSVLGGTHNRCGVSTCVACPALMHCKQGVLFAQRCLHVPVPPSPNPSLPMAPVCRQAYTLAHELYGCTRMLLAALDRDQLAEVCQVCTKDVCCLGSARLQQLGRHEIDPWVNSCGARCGRRLHGKLRRGVARAGKRPAGSGRASTVLQLCPGGACLPACVPPSVRTAPHGASTSTSTLPFPGATRRAGTATCTKCWSPCAPCAPSTAAPGACLRWDGGGRRSHREGGLACAGCHHRQRTWSVCVLCGGAPGGALHVWHQQVALHLRAPYRLPAGHCAFAGNPLTPASLACLVLHLWQGITRCLTFPSLASLSLTSPCSYDKALVLDLRTLNFEIA